MLFIFKIIFSLFNLFFLLQAQGGLAVKADNAEVKEDESVKINVLRNDNIIDKTNLSIEDSGNLHPYCCSSVLSELKTNNETNIYQQQTKTHEMDQTLIKNKNTNEIN